MVIPEVEVKETVKETETKHNWPEALRVGKLTSTELSELEIIPRKMVAGGFCFEGDLGFIFAARGLGKTWLGMYLAKCAALCQDCGPWEIKLTKEDEFKVLYVDGEMPPADIKARDILLGVPTDRLSYINHEILFEKTGLTISMADPEFQKAFLEMVVEEGVKIVFFDNLSTLSPGVDENKGPDWDQILPFLMQLRRAHITVIFIHHAGRNGQMRGHSKREDPSAWILRLDSPNEDDTDEGAHFISRFTKWRNASRQPASLEWVFHPKKDGGIDIQVETASNIDIFKDLVESGINTCKNVADEMGVSKAYISKLARKGESEGWLKISGSKYEVIDQKQRYSATSSDP